MTLNLTSGVCECPIANYFYNKLSGKCEEKVYFIEMKPYYLTDVYTIMIPFEFSEPTKFTLFEFINNISSVLLEGVDN